MIKQKLLFGLFLTLYLTPARSQDNLNQMDEQGKRHGLWEKTFDGTDQIRYRGNFNHGNETGLFEFYKLVKGKSLLSATRQFDSKSDTIAVKFYASTGKIISEGAMIGKNFVGKWVYYHNKTKGILTVEYYNNQGKLEGERNVYYENGQMAEQSFYKDGKLEGTSKIFSDTGVVIKIFEYKNGQLNGLSQYFDGAGQMLAEGHYKNDQKNGIWKYYENGILTEEKDFTKHSKNPIKQ